MDCQKNVPIPERFFLTTPYTAIPFSERYYDKRYKPPIGLLQCKNEENPGLWKGEGEGYPALAK